jgi:biopolymer transport protein ExbB
MSSAISTNVFSLIQQGGITMWPLLGLSVMTVGCAIERGLYWGQLLGKEDQIVHDVLETARYNLEEASRVAYQARNLAIGRFLFATLRMGEVSPETFRLAMDAAAEKEFIKMRKGDKLLETVVGLGPLIGLLGTVTGLMTTFGSIDIGGGGANAASLSKAAAGISEGLITTAAGMLVAIVALVFYRIFLSLQTQQIDYFTNVGNQLELIYRHIWLEGQGQLRRPEGRSSESQIYAPHDVSGIQVSALNAPSFERPPRVPFFTGDPH